jgi:hypothetical protein
VDSAFGKAHLPVRYEKRGRRRTGLVRQDDLDAFVGTFATTTQLCRETGLHHQTLRRRLREAGVAPVLEIPKVKLRVYRRSDIDGVHVDHAV